MSERISIKNRIQSIKDKFHEKYPDGRKDPRISNLLFGVSFSVMALYVILKPVAGPRLLFVGSVMTTVFIFAIMSIGLNIHTGITGMVNFGVIFFAGIGAVTTGLLNSKFGWDPIISISIGIVIAVIVGYYLAYPTVKLRTDYFAIVTIALGEILRLLLTVETSLRSRTEGSNISSPGIAHIKGPFQSSWEKISTVPYVAILMIIALFSLVLVYMLAQFITNSPYGRVLRTIREDEDIVEAYGYDVFRYKAVSLAIGSGIMALGGGIWAWLIGNIFPDFMNPVTSTFIVWAAFVLGGKGNNKGMIAGSFFIILIDRIIRSMSGVTPSDATSLSVCAQETSWGLCIIDRIFQFIVIDVEKVLFGTSSYETFLGNEKGIHIDVNYIRYVLIGLIIILVMFRYSDGFLPELPYKPKVDYKVDKSKNTAVQYMQDEEFTSNKKSESKEDHIK